MVRIVAAILSLARGTVHAGAELYEILAILTQQANKMLHFKIRMGGMPVQRIRV
jgi:hypothetical protein